MSSTSNAQDLLVNVFRPTYRWDSNTGFVPSLTISNVTEIITGSVTTDRLAVSDSNLNTYIGSNAGATANDTASNVGLGYSAMAGANNSSNNVAVGMFSLDGLTNSDCNVALGARTDITGRGQRNVLIGPNVTMGDGSGNILIGVDISAGNITKRFQLGTLLYGDLSSGYVGINTSEPKAALDISGIVVFRDKVGFQNPDPVYSLDVAGSLYASEQIIGGKGTQSNPMYTFIDSSGSGMYVPASWSGFGTGAFAIAVNRAPAAIFSSNAVNFYQNLDVSGTFSARGVVLDGFAVENGTAAIPTMTFKNDSSSGLFLVGTDRIGVSTDGLRRMEILPTGDVSMGRLVTKDISYSGTIVGTDPTTCNVIGGVTLSNGNVILTGTSTNTNLLVPGWIRNSATSFVLDISGGNISNAGTTLSSNVRASAGTAGVPAYSFASDPSTGLHSGGTSQLAFDTAGLRRMVISNGNVGIGTATPVVALEVVGDVSATTYNGPGGTQSAPHYTFSDDRTTGVFFPGANMIGLTAGGTERMRISNANIGIGTTAPANALDVSGTLRVIGTSGDLTFSNGSIRLGGATLISSTGVLSNANTTSNIIGGVTLSNTNISYAGTITGSTANTNNSIGGVTLSNTNISYAGTITGSTANTNNSIGGVTLSNTNISYAGAISNATDSASNRIGGVTLSNTNISYAGTITGSTANTNNSIGGVTLSNTNISYAGAISNATDSASNRIGGVTLSNTNISYAGAITGSTDDTFNRIGGVTLSNGTAIIGGFLRNALTPSQFDISGGNISNSGQTRSSIFQGSAGSTGGPTYGFNGDPGTGLYRPSTGTLAIASGGTNRMTIDPYGTVSIVQSTPPSYAYALNVTGDVSAGEIIGQTFLSRANGNAAGPTIGFFTATSEWGLFAPNTNQIGFATSGSNRMTILDTGNVGIRTTNPAQLLDLSGGAIQIKRPAVSTTLNSIILGDTLGTGDGFRFGIGLQGATSTGNAGCDLAITGYSDTNTQLPAANTPYVVVKRSNGFVGIGTTNPQYMLDISTATVSQGIRISSFNAQVNLKSTGADAFQIYASDTAQGMYTTNTLPIQFASGGSTKMTLTSAGNLGIGTPIPAYPLHVVGEGHFRDSGLNSGTVRLGDTAGGLILQRDQAGHGYVRASAAANLYLGTSNTNWMTLTTAGNLGLSQANPQYRLDVTSAATTAAAVNMSTWPRYAVSTTHMVKIRTGDAGTAIRSVLWPAPAISLDANLGTVTNDAANGTYFVCKRSGLWSITTSLHGNSATPTYIIDVSDNITYNDAVTINSRRMVAGTIGGYYYATINFTGYLPSNDNLYYKFRCSGLGPDTLSSYLYIAFLNELPAASGFPYS